MFPNHIQNQDFLNSVTMVHHLAEFFKITGEEVKSKDSALQTPSSSSFLNYLPATKQETATFIQQVNIVDLKCLIRQENWTFMVDLQASMEEVEQATNHYFQEITGGPKTLSSSKKSRKSSTKAPSTKSKHRTRSKKSSKSKGERARQSGKSSSRPKLAPIDEITIPSTIRSKSACYDWEQHLKENAVSSENKETNFTPLWQM